MVKISFFDISNHEAEYLSRLFHGSGYRLTFIPESITLESLNRNDDVISVGSSSDVTMRIIEHLPKLRMIACRSVDFDNISLSATASRGIVVSIVPRDNSKLKDYTEWHRTAELTANNIVNFFFGVPLNQVSLPVKKMGQLIIVRHGESEWNALNKWTGTTDVHLSSRGFRQAVELGRALADIKIDHAYVSQQMRARETLEAILDASRQFKVPYSLTSAINERDYGELTGKNKWEIKATLGDEVFNRLHNDWNFPIHKVETLKEVSGRVLPFYLEIVLPRLKRGQNVLIVAHANSIRTLMKYIENVADKHIAHLDHIRGMAIIYTLNELGRLQSKQERRIELF